MTPCHTDYANYEKENSILYYKGRHKPLRFSEEVTQSCDDISRSNFLRCRQG